MLEGRVCLAVRLLTEPNVGGVLDPEAEANGEVGPLGKFVYEILKAKHPVQKLPDHSAFLECKSMPHLE